MGKFQTLPINPPSSMVNNEEDENNEKKYQTLRHSTKPLKVEPQTPVVSPRENYVREENTFTVVDIDNPTTEQKIDETQNQMEDAGLADQTDKEYTDPRIEAAIVEARKNYAAREKDVSAEKEYYEGLAAQYGKKPEAFFPDMAEEEARTEGYEKQIQEEAEIIREYMNSTENPIHRKLIDELLDKGYGTDSISRLITTAELTPIVGTAMAVEEIDDDYALAQELWREGDLGDKGLAVGLGFITAAELLGTAVVGGKATAKLLGAKNVKKYARAKLNSKQAAEAGSEAAEEAAGKAKKVAEANPETKQAFIEAFEERTGKIISTGDKGNKVIDPTLTRKAGKETSEEIQNYKNKPVKDTLEEGVVAQTVQFAHLTDDPDVLMSPLLKPEKFDAIVAIATDLKKSNPEAFGKKKTIIDDLFELSVDQELFADDKLGELLTKYNISYDDFVLSVVGSGSEAGKILNKLSQIAKARPVTAVNAAKEKAAREAAGNIRRTVLRVENIRRGALVSQLATASRNLTSGMIRAPMESLGNVMDESLYRLSNDGLGDAVGAIFNGDVWTDSFRQMKYMFRNPVEAKRYTDMLLDRPELGDQYDRMFNNLNEIQALTGRGKGGVGDTILTALEDGVGILNTPNRMQEYLIRRGAFFGELERLSRREWGIDLVDTLNQGKIRDLLNDAKSVRPSGGRSFMDLVDDSVNRALDLTYAKQPDIPVFQGLSNFITQNGLTVVMPFPRFMFNSMELLGQYAAGASIPITRKMASIVMKGQRGPLTAKDRQRIQRNIMGWSAIGAAYMYRTSDDANPDYKMLNTSEGEMLDTTPQYPLRQFLYLGEAAKRLFRDGTVSDWFNVREFQDTFLGVNFRTGVGNVFIEEVAELASGLDLTAKENAAKVLGGALGNYLSTWLVPFAQVVESQRAAGLRGTEYKDVREDPDMGFWSTLGNEVKRPFDQRGFSMLPSTEEQLPEREFLYAGDGTKERQNVLSRVIFGLNFQERDAQYGEYLKGKGMQEWELGSKSRVPTVQRMENKELRKHIPTIVDNVKNYENIIRTEYNVKSPDFKKDITEEQYVNSKVVPLIQSQVNNLKRELRETDFSASDPYLQAQVQYRRLGGKFRKYASVQFYERFGRFADASNTRDLQQLVEIGKTYKSEIRK